MWKQTLETLSGLSFEFASQYDHVKIVASNKLAVVFPARYNQGKLFCERPDQLAELERLLSDAAGRPMRLEFNVLPGEAAEPVRKTSTRPSMEQRQKAAATAEHPMVKKAVELFGAEITRVDTSQAETTPTIG